MSPAPRIPIALVGLVLALPAAATAESPSPAGLGPAAASAGAVETLVLPSVDLAPIRAEDAAREAAGLPPRFAVRQPVEVAPEVTGTWEWLDSGTLLWRQRIVSPGAAHLNLGFTRYRMPPGGRLFVYATGGGHGVGPFTAADNEAHGELWTPVVRGDDVTVEVQVPVDLAADLELELTAVHHGYRGFGAPSLPTDSGSCNVDVICPEGNGWRDQLRSVAVITISGTGLCTGFAVNNTAQDGTPYFMTANHCGISPGSAPSLVFYWNFENSTCRAPGSPQSGGPGDGSLSQFNSGSIWRAAYAPSDFNLLELDDPLDPAHNVFLAGWDATSADSPFAVAIHHPRSDEKRISFENDPTTTTSYLGTSVPGNGTHVRITDWDLGTTEGGSSGSPLFNADQRVYGQLHGGGAACGNDFSDWYGRFSVSWTGGGTSSSRLSDWLDPGGTGALTLDGLDTGFGIFADGFESGDLSAWSEASP